MTDENDPQARLDAAQARYDAAVQDWKRDAEQLVQMLSEAEGAAQEANRRLWDQIEPGHLGEPDVLDPLQLQAAQAAALVSIAHSLVWWLTPPPTRPEPDQFGLRG